MSDEPPTCAKCGDEYTMDPGHDPTTYCDGCAHVVAEGTEALRAAAQALVDKIESLRPWPLWMQMVKDDLAALEAALKAVGS